MTIHDAFKGFITELGKIYAQREATTIADWIFEDIAHVTRLQRSTDKLKPMDPEIEQELKTALFKLLNHTPVQYVLGEAWFYKMKLKVNQHVLIPRPETEELVTWIIEDYRNDAQLKTVLDIGTGSGCISIALKNELRPLSIMAIDVSSDALSVAIENAGNRALEIDFRKIDFLDVQSDNLPQFDIIVSNPPYISSADKALLAKHVRDQEPHLALFVDKSDPLTFYRKIAEFALTHLKLSGSIYVEIHEDQGLDIQQVFERHNFQSIIRKDMYGRNRMMKIIYVR